jgi:phosphate transport system ATP-binding protein
MAQANYALNIEGLSIWYNNSPIIKNLNIKILSSSITALVGPSGCGKSTLLNYICGLLENKKPWLIKGQLKYSQHHDLIGLVLQKPICFPISILKNMTIALHERKKSKQECFTIAQQALEQVGLWSEVCSRLNEPALTLSGGQQQRLCLARILALKPKLLLLDEPCSSIDPISTASIEATLKEISSDTSILIATHNLQQAIRLSRQTIVMWNVNEGGEVLEQGDTFEMCKKTQSHLAHQYLTGQLG